MSREEFFSVVAEFLGKFSAIIADFKTEASPPESSVSEFPTVAGDAEVGALFLVDDLILGVCLPG